MSRVLTLALLLVALRAEAPFLNSELIFSPERLHNHSSSIVELPDGTLLTCWYRGSGERTADDVVVMASRLRPRMAEWTKPFVLADVDGFPDTNPVLFVDSRRRLWLFWQTIVANQWHTAITNYRISSHYGATGVPQWDSSSILLLKPRNFEERVKRYAESLPAHPHKDLLLARAGDKYFQRMGWMNRAHPLELPSGRLLVPLYSDGYSLSLVAITDDGGATWQSSEPIVAPGGVQPSIVRRKDGSLVAYMRDNGPPPKRLQTSESKDDGITWTAAIDADIPNPGSSVEVIRLRDGRWLMLNNDTERGRHSLLASLSADDGVTWKWKRHLELDPNGKDDAHYPSVIEASDGSLHATYSYYLNHLGPDQPRQTIKHAHFNAAWVEEGDPKK